MSSTAKIIGGIGLATIGVFTGQPWLASAGVGIAMGGVYQALSPAPRLGAGGARGPDAQIPQTIPPELVVYGRALIPGTPAFVGRHSERVKNQPDREFSHWIYLHTRRRPLDGIEAIVVGGKWFDLVPNGRTSVWFPADALIPDGGPFKTSIAIWFKRGADDDDAFRYLMNKVPDKWTDSHRLSKISATYVVYRFRAELWPNGPPEIKFFVRGFLVNDPRHPAAAPAWSENAALCYADALYGPHAGAGAVDPSLIDPTALTAAANTCDEQLTTKTGDVVVRYRCGGWADATTDYDKILSDLLGSFAGTRVRVGATYKIYAGAPRAVQASLTAADLAGPVRVQPLRELSALTNEVHTLYPDERASYADSTTPTWPRARGGAPGGGGGSGGGTSTGGWDLQGLFNLGQPAAADYWVGHTDAVSNATISQLPSGMALKGGTMGDETKNGLALWSKVHVVGDFEVQFSTRKKTARSPASGQADMGLRFYFYTWGYSGVGRPFYISTWAPATNPNRATYAAGTAGGYMRMYHMTQADSDESEVVSGAVSMNNATGTSTALTVDDTATALDYTYDVQIQWNFKAVGNNLRITYTNTGTSDVHVFNVDISGLPKIGAFGFVGTAGLTVNVGGFQLVSGTIVSPGALLASPYRWAGTAISYAFPSAGFAGWRATSDATVTTPLQTGFTPAPAAMQAGFRAAFAALASAGLGLSFTEVGSNSAQIVVAVSNTLNGTGFDSYEFGPPSGAVFVRPAVSTQSWASGGYAYQLALNAILHAIGLVAPPAGSDLDDYGLTLLIRDSSAVTPWATAPRQADVDAARIAYDQTVAAPAADAPPAAAAAAINPYRLADGGQQLVRELRQPFVPFTEQCQRVQKIWLVQHRYQTTLSAAFLPTAAFLLEPVAVVSYDDPLTGWVGKKFQIARYKRRPDGPVELSLAEYGDDIYDWSAGELQLENSGDETGTIELVDDEATTEAGTAVQLNPLDNDPDADHLTISAVATPAHGTVDLSDDGRTVTYTPASGWTGYDVFTYTATDGAGTGTGTITVQTVAANAILAVDDYYTITDDKVHVLDVLANDHPLAATKTITARTNPIHGTAVTKSDGTITYQRNKGFSGFDSFKYTASANSQTSQARVNLTIGKGGGSGGGQNSGLPWASGWTSQNGDPDAVGAGGLAFAKWRAGVTTTLYPDIANFRCPRFHTLGGNDTTDVYGYLSNRASQYATAYSNNIRVEQVIPMVPSGEGKGSYKTIFAACAAGSFDADHRKIARLINGYNRVGRTIIRLAHECGSGSQADAYVNDPSPQYVDFRNAWARIAAIYKAEIDGVLMDWNNIQNPADPRLAYPGDDAVDIISVDAYGQVTPAKDLIVSDADWNAYANKGAGQAPQGPRAWYLYAKSQGKLFGVAEWGLSPKLGPSKPSAADSPRYIQGMWDLFNEAAADGRMEYDAYFNVKDGDVDHRIWYSGNPNPDATTRYKNLWSGS